MGQKTYVEIDRQKECSFPVKEVWIMDFNNNMNYKDIMCTLNSVQFALNKRGVLQPRYILCHSYDECDLSSFKKLFNITNIQIQGKNKHFSNQLVHLYNYSKLQSNILDDAILLMFCGTYFPKSKIINIRSNENCIVGNSDEYDVCVSGTIIRYAYLEILIHVCEEKGYFLCNIGVKRYLSSLSPFDRYSYVKGGQYISSDKVYRHSHIHFPKRLLPQ